MSRLRRAAWIALLLPVLAVAVAATGAPRNPLAVKAEQSFYATFNHDPRVRAAPLRDLWTAAVADPSDATTWLLLGLDHLWMAAEGDKTNPLTVEHLVLAERFLSRAQELDPVDRRIPSWLIPVKLSLAEFNGQESRRKEIFAELLAAYREDPVFHSFSVALLSFDAPPGSPEFRRGLDAMRAANERCASPEGDPNCGDRPHWPHSSEAFRTFEADYELKAGNPDRARELLVAVQRLPGYATWPFRGEAEDRLKNLDALAALYADADRGNDPPTLMALSQGTMCQSCHLGP
jgi:hypothetical protein